MTDDHRFPPSLKALFRTVIADQLTMIDAQKFDMPFSADDVPFTVEGQSSYEELKRIILTDPNLAHKFTNSYDWCTDDDERAWLLNRDIRDYVTLAADRQVALGRFELTEADFEGAWREIRDYALRETLDWQFVAPIKRLALQGADSVRFRSWRVIRNSPAQAFADLHPIVSKVLISARRA